MDLSPQILLVDDEQDWRQRLAKDLSQLGYDIVQAANGKEALAYFNPHVDLVILDLEMPDLDGIAVCRQLRKRSLVPVVFLCATARPDQIVEVLEMGADDFITKPVDARQLDLRMKAIFRRSRQNQPDGSIYHLGNIHLNADTREVTVGGVPVELSPIQYRLLHFFMSHAGQTHSKETLSEKVWEQELFNANVVEMAVRRLRTKIESDPSAPDHVVTVFGVGYQFK